MFNHSSKINFEISLWRRFWGSAVLVMLLQVSFLPYGSALAQSASVQVVSETGYIQGYTNGQLVVSAYGVISESDGVHVIKFKRAENLLNSFKITVKVMESTAKQGADFLLNTNSCLFEVGQVDAVLSVVILNNDKLDGPRTIWLSLETEGASVQLGQQQIILQISDDDRIGLPGGLDPNSPNILSGSSVTSVHRLVKQADGKVLVLHDSSSLGYFFRLNAEGDPDPTFVGSSKSFVAGAWTDSKDRIYLGHSFYNNQFERLLPDGSLDGAFNVLLDRGISAFAALPDGKLLIGGGFTTVNGVARNRVARLFEDGTLDEEFELQGEFFSDCTDFVFVGKDYFSARLLSLVGGVGFSAFSRFGSDGALDRSRLVPSFDAGNKPAVLDVRDGTWWVGRTHLFPDGAVQKLNLKSASQAPVPPSFLEIVEVFPDGRILADDGTLFDSAGIQDNEFKTDILGSVNSAVFLNNGKLLVGGSFSLVNGVPRRSLALLIAKNTNGPARVMWANHGQSAVESGSVVLTLRRSGNPSTPFAVRCRTRELDAKAGEDFSKSVQDIHFEPGVLTMHHTVKVLEDDLAENDERFAVHCEVVSGEAVFEGDSSTEVVILDNEGRVRWMNSDVVGSESQGQIILGVERIGGVSYPVEVQWAKSAGNISAPHDWSADEGAGVFFPGVTYLPMNITVVDNARSEGDRSADIKLTSSAAAYPVQAAAGLLHLLLQDNDLGGVPGEAADNYISNISYDSELGVTLSGRFSTFSGEPVSELLRLDRWGRRETNFVPLVALNSGTSVHVSGGGRAHVPVSYQTNLASSPAFGIASLDSHGALTRFSALPRNESVRSLHWAPDGAMYVSGYDADFAGAYVDGFYSGGPIVRLKEDGSRDERFAIYASDIGRAQLAFNSSGAEFWMVGEARFRVYGERLTMRDHLPLSGNRVPLAVGLVKMSSRGAFPPQPGPTLEINDGTTPNPGSIVRLQNGDLVVGGNFTGAGGLHRDCIFKMNDQGMVDPVWNPELRQHLPPFWYVLDLAGSRDGGCFAILSAVQQGRVFLVKINEDGHVVREYGIHTLDGVVFYEPVSMVVLPDNTVFLGGNFSAVDTQPRARFARLHPDGTLASSTALYTLIRSSSGETSIWVDSKLEGRAYVESSKNFQNWDVLQAFDLKPGLQEIVRRPLGAGDTFEFWRVRVP